MDRRDRRTASRASLACIAMIASLGASAGPQRAVVELYTSQGCSSCPPADAFAGRLRTDPSVLVLSFHVDYWDGQGWKDPFSSPVSTARQYAYARGSDEPSVFTPQMIVNGTLSLVGSSEAPVLRAIAAAKTKELPVRAELTLQPDGTVKLALAGPELVGDIWEVRYVRSAVTAIRAGENGGRTLETYNNVTHLEHLGSFKPGVRILPPLSAPADGIAILVQTRGPGRMLGAVSYEAPQHQASLAP
jgi:hypothetical protein